MSSQKPPLGLMPKAIWHDKVRVDRLKEVRAAIARYLESGTRAPDEWISEERELSTALSHIDLSTF